MGSGETVPVEKGGIDANFLCANQIPKSFQKGLPVWPACIRAAVGFFKVEEQRQFPQIAIEQVEPQFRLLSWFRPAVVEPVGTPGQTGFLCPAPVVLEIGIDPQVLSGANDDEICRQVHPREIDLLRCTGVILVKTYIGTNDLPRHSNLLA